ncbi:PREDICTED: leukocyte-associated immunoglobulin-like receptor 2 isoform X8 [Hipposideros armiger]|uniref:Leukocyte-associated immunoglobulin-like receptor 2 isoform X8 n=1 Tax=Hipposideros armiger TaxID=186990 RepID=A0A8B7PXX8_HIPAR|nr:PREDICTED: leukocyte-associated immunoglobulin-like receptor 2 isoform X8 [Hipposideros armiger]
MTPHPTTLLGLALWGNRGLGVFLIRASLPVLCLGQIIHMQNGLLPRPSIRAEPGPVVARGQPVTILCRGPAGVHRFRLEQKENTPTFMDQKNIPQRGSLETEARFLIPAVSEVTAGTYRCVYMKGSDWSERSDVLELKLKDEPVPVLPSGPLSNKGEEQRPQERLSPAVDTIERTPDVATVDKLPEKDREMHTPSPAAGDPQEVTYAQLDHRTLTLRADRAVSPQATEPMADSSTYAAIARR